MNDLERVRPRAPNASASRPRDQMCQNMPIRFGAPPVTETPDWISHGVLYEIYIRSFQDHAGDGIGDFQGILDRLGYIESLGVKGILLNCPFQSFPGNARHPLVDWMRPDPVLGSLSDILLLFEAAHAKGLRVLASLPIDSTSTHHPWFLDSRKAHGRNFRNSYFWADRMVAPPSSQESLELQSWAKDDDTGRYYWYQDRKAEPSLNYGDPELREEIRRVFEHWLTLGLDGFRLAGSGRLNKQGSRGIEPIAQPSREIYDIVAPLRSAFPDRVFLLETGTSIRGALQRDPRIFYHFNGFFPSLIRAVREENKEPLAQALFSGEKETYAKKELPIRWVLDLRERSEETFESFREEDGDVLHSPSGVLPGRTILSRPARLMENGRRRMLLCSSLFLTFPGLPVLYYGDEIGMGDHPHLPDRNTVRTPMQWSSDRNAGFSQADPEELYNPVIDDPAFSYTMINVESQERFSDSHLSNIRRMIETRNRHSALTAHGTFRTIETTHPALFAFVRRREDSLCLFLHNLSKSSICGLLHLGEYATLLPRELFGGSFFPRIPRHPYLMTLTPYAFMWFELVRPPSRPKQKHRKGSPS